MPTANDYHELKATDRLPSPSGTALAIMKIAQQPDFTLEEIVQLVKSDPALSGRILRFANSALLGANRAIVNVLDAAMMVGIQTLRNIALSLSLLDKNQAGPCQKFDYTLYWAQSLAMAVAMSELTTYQRTAPPEEAFTLGLLANIGRLGLASVWPDVYSECLQQAQGEQLLQLEQVRFAINHQNLTLNMLNDWGIPQPFLEALKLSYSTEILENHRIANFAKQIRFARHLAKYCIASEEYQSILQPSLASEAELHGFDQTKLLNLLETIKQKWQAWGKEINVKTEVTLNLVEHSVEASNTANGLDLLLVDDDPIMITRLFKQLSTAGYQVSVCNDGESALKHIQEHRPSLLITDWRMYPMDGLELCKALRSSALGKNIYIVMLTAETNENELVNAFDAGIDDYVTKPVSTRVLLSRLRAGQRIVRLQQEVEKERNEVQRYMAELKASNQRLERMAYTDMLTELPNRRYAMNRLHQEFEVSKRYHRPLSVLMLDLDHFKLINDSLGHDVGDQVLVHTAKVVRAAIRAIDIACRLGGEEFIVIVPNTEGKIALTLAERIRSAIQHNQPPGIPLLNPLTISIGVAGLTPTTNHWKDLMLLADQALYQVKQTTRNGVQLA